MSAAPTHLDPPTVPPSAADPGEAGGSALPDDLRRAQDRFVGLWGQMASSWGIPRSMAEVHALLYIRDEPLNTDDIMDVLGVSRGNVSMTLRALLDWGVVSRVHVRGDRKDYFRAEQDVWKLFRTILRERKKREIEPLLEALQECRELTVPPPPHKHTPRLQQPPTAVHRRCGGDIDEADRKRLAAHNRRLDEMLEFIQLIDSISERLISSPDKRLALAAKLLAKAG